MKELEIQKYLRSSKTLTDLKQEYHIDFYLNEDLDVVVFNYTHLSPMDNEIVKESRALFLENNTWDVVAKSVGGFLDINHVNASSDIKKFNWNDAKAISKYDGCLVVIYYWKNEWRLGTRFSTDGKCNVFSPNSGESKIHWIDVFKNTLVEYRMDWNSFTNLLDKNKTYSFELCTPWNRNTVIYPYSIIKLISITNIETLIEEDINEPKLKVFEPEIFTVNSLEEVRELISENDDPLELEGFVVVDKNFKRLKVKNPKYDVLSFNSYSMDDFKSLKNYSNAIQLVASGGVVFYCVICNPNPGFGSPSTTCFAGDYPVYPPELNCNVTVVADCVTDCLGYTPPGGGGVLSIQSTKTCSTSWNPKASNIIKDIKTDSLVKDFVNFIFWFNNKYLEYKVTKSDLVKEELISIWSYAFDELSKGKSISEIIISSSELDQMLALELYQLIQSNN